MKPYLSFFLISISLWVLFDVASSIPAPKVQCRPNEFYDDVALTWHSCSLCYVRPEGTMFRKLCEACNCTDINSTASQVSTTAPVISTFMLKNTTSVGTMSLPFYHRDTQPTLVTSTNSNKLIVMVVSLLVVLAIVFLSLAIFYLCMRRSRQHRSSTEGHVQGCFSRCPAKTPIPCSEKDENNPSTGDPEANYTDSQGDVNTEKPNYVTGRSPTY